MTIPQDPSPAATYRSSSFLVSFNKWPFFSCLMVIASAVGRGREVGGCCIFRLGAMRNGGEGLNRHCLSLGSNTLQVLLLFPQLLNFSSMSPRHWNWLNAVFVVFLYHETRGWCSTSRVYNQVFIQQQTGNGFKNWIHPFRG